VRLNGYLQTVFEVELFRRQYPREVSFLTVDFEEAGSPEYHRERQGESIEAFLLEERTRLWSATRLRAGRVCAGRVKSMTGGNDRLGTT
jgi:hypothetical protein